MIPVLTMIHVAKLEWYMVQNRQHYAEQANQIHIKIHAQT